MYTDTVKKRTITHIDLKLRKNCIMKHDKQPRSKKCRM